VDLIERAGRALNFYNDALADHRQRICQNVSALGALVLLPFVVTHLLGANWLMAGVNTALVTLLTLTAWLMHRGRPAPVPFWVLGVAIVAGVLISVFRQGVPGILWSYPAMFVCYFILQRRVAMLLGAVLTVGVTVASAMALEPSLAARVFGSLAFVMTMINVVLNVIGDLQQALVAQTITDPLTGAYNRRHLDTQLGERVASAEAAPPVDALLVIDIDHFKRINDSHGHDVGDEVLRKVVTAVASRKRRSDMLFRLGGEEFVLLLPGAALEQAQQIAEELRQRLALAELLPGEAVTVSIGVSALHPGETADAWIKSADRALYRAKRSGRNRVELAEMT
jgi:diguanylate cyclase (GGDEF)-like protein